MSRAAENPRAGIRPGARGLSQPGGKGSHRNFTQPNVAKPVTLSGQPGDDAKQYQIRAVKLAIEEAQK